MWSETLWCMFVFLEANQPKDEQSYQSILGEYTVTDAQITSSRNLVTEVEASSLDVPEKLEGASRGTQSFMEIISKFEAEVERYGSRSSFSASSCVAREVDPDRVNFISPAGSIDPANILRGPEKEAYLNQARLIKGEEGRYEECEVKGCSMVRSGCEEKLYRRLLDSKMAVLVPESELALKPDGSLF